MWLFLLVGSRGYLVTTDSSGFARNSARVYNTDMRVGIDVSQMAYEGTGVSQYLEQLVSHLVKLDSKNEYILFFSSLRKQFPVSNFKFLNKSQLSNSKITIKRFKLPPMLLDLMWNKLHIVPIEKFIGDVDVFISSDWTQPSARKAKMATILYDFIVYKYPEETHDQTEFSFKKLIFSPNIVATQKRKLKWAKKECDVFFCISESTKKDAMEILGLPENKLKVIYPGITL